MIEYNNGFVTLITCENIYQIRSFLCSGCLCSGYNDFTMFKFDYYFNVYKRFSKNIYHKHMLALENVNKVC